MSKLYLCAASVVLSLVFALPASAQSGKPRPGIDYVAGELLVKYKPAVRGKAKARPVMPRGRLKSRFSSLDIEHWQLPSDADLFAEIERLKASGQVVLAEPNFIRYPTLVPSGDTLYQNNQALAARLGLPTAWDTTEGAGAVVAVIDDAFDTTHLDLANNLIGGQAFGNDYGTGVTDPTDVNPDPGACSGLVGAHEHGTQVAGVIRAVARKASIMPLKAGCTLDVVEELDAINYAINNGADIINISYAGANYSQTEYDGIRAAVEGTDIIIITAAGNYHGNNGSVPQYPASLPIDNIVSVAATESTTTTDALTHWSHWGATTVDLAAPGVNLYTTAIFNAYRDAATGTSFAAPVVAGVAALLKADKPAATLSDLKGALMGSVTPLANSTGRMVTDGRVHALDALAAINAPKPVLVIDSVVVDDTAQGDGDSWLEAGETATVSITVKNLWAAATSVQATLQSTHISGAVTVAPANQAIASIGTSATAVIAFDVQLGNAGIGFQRLPFDLTFSFAGTNQTRRFALDSGELSNTQLVQTQIQRDVFDEFHTYEFDVPADAQDLVFELAYDPASDANRDVGLAVTQGERPQINFTKDGGYQLLNGNASHIRQDESGVVRIPWAPSTLTPGAYFVTAFNLFREQPDAGYTSYVPYSVRACHTTTAGGNQAPTVQFLGVQTQTLLVDAGVPVTLNTSVFDPEGDNTVVHKWWSQVSDGTAQKVTISDYTQDSISFTAPQTGSLTFIRKASDNHCALGQNSVVVTVRNDQTPGTPVITTDKSVYTTVLGHPMNISVTVQGGASRVYMKSFPDGASFQSFNGTHLFSWSNPGPVGDYQVVFAAVDDENPSLTVERAVTVSVVTSSSTNQSTPAGGGCSVGRPAAVDPTLWTLAVISFLLVRRRRN